MQSFTKPVLAVGLFACVVLSALQASAKKPHGAACSIVNGACVTLNCPSGCGPLFPATCTCVGN